MPAPLVKAKLVLLSIPTFITGCMPGPTATKDQITSLTRHNYNAQLAQSQTTELSLLATPTYQPSQGADIIYIHGTPGSATAYADYLIQDAALNIAAVATDRPGFGNSKDTGPITSFEQQAKAIEPLLPPASSNRKATLVGHSLGGPIAAAATTLFKDRVKAAVIVAGSLDPGLENPRWFNHAGNLFFTRPFLPNDLKVSNEEILDAPLQTKWLDQLLRDNWPDPAIPIYVIHGTKDSLVPYDNVSYMSEVFGSINLTTIEREGHFILWSHDTQIRQIIADILHTSN